MNDILLALVILTIASACLFAVGHYVAHCGSRRCVSLAVWTNLVSLLVFLLFFHGTWRMANLLPVSSVIILGNWIPLGGAFFAGILLGKQQLPLWRRRWLAGLLLVVMAYSVACCFQGRLTVAEYRVPSIAAGYQRWNSSCGPCSAAVLLRHYGMDATEEELVGLCFTSHRGCPALGLYRGLKLKTEGTEWDVEVLHCSVEELLRQENPVLLRVRLPRQRGVDESVLHWRKAQFFQSEHAVLLLGRGDCGHVKVIDPAIDSNMACCWFLEDLYTMWRGEGLTLVRRK